MDSAGSHFHYHFTGDLETTTNFQYSPAINSISHIIKSTIKFLEILDKKKFGVDFYVPTPSTVVFQLSLSHENFQIAERYGGALPFKKRILYWSYIYNAHPHDHWCAHIKKLWRHKE